MRGTVVTRSTAYLRRYQTRRACKSFLEILTVFLTGDLTALAEYGTVSISRVTIFPTENVPITGKI